LAIVVGNGIYTNLGLQLLSVSSNFTILALWLISGICALCGALSYAELSSLMPHSGGEYYYLSRVYHPALGTMGGVMTQYGGMIAPTALASMAFAKYLSGIFPFASPTLIAIALVTVITGTHLINLGFSAGFQDIITALKFLLVGTIVFFGFHYATQSPTIFIPTSAALKELFLPGSGVTLLFCYYAYAGWSSATYIADDVSSSRKTVGRSLIIGTVLATVIYLAMNAVFLMSAPNEELRGVIDIGHVVATHLLGEHGGNIMAFLIATGLMAGVSGMIWVGPRITQMMGKDLPALTFFNRLSPSNVPVRAMILQYLLVVLLLLTSSFKIVLVSSQFTLLSCQLLTVFGVTVLRKKQPSVQEISPEIFRSPLYPLPQTLFIGVGLLALTYTLITNPVESAIGIGVMLFGLALYPLFRWRR
jgi:APA family basic amino acid/polyamine antiporter